MSEADVEGTPALYEIWVRGELGERLASDLDVRRLELHSGKTLLVVEVIDQAHLHGVLERLRDLNVELESVGPCNERAS